MLKKLSAACAAFFLFAAPLIASAASIDLSPAKIQEAMRSSMLDRGVQVAMDRTTTYTGQNPQSVTLNLDKRNIRIGVGTYWWNEQGSSLGDPGRYANCMTVPVTGLYVAVSPSSSTTNCAVYIFGIDDASGYGGFPAGTGTYLPSDSTRIEIQGIQGAGTSTASIGPLTVGSSAGQSVINLIECTVATFDTTSQAVNIVSPSGTVTATTANRDRVDRPSCMAKASSSSATPSTPAADSGYVPISAAQIPYGTSVVTTGMISSITSSLFTGFLQIAPVVNNGSLVLSGTIGSRALSGSIFGVAGSASSFTVGNAGTSQFTLIGNGASGFGTTCAGIATTLFAVAGAALPTSICADEAQNIGIGNNLAVAKAVTAAPLINGVQIAGNTPPLYNANGSAAGSGTAHGAFGSCSMSSATTCTISLTSNAVFTAQSSYSCSVSTNGNILGFAVNTSTSVVTVNALSTATGTYYVACTGY